MPATVAGSTAQLLNYFEEKIAGQLVFQFSLRYLDLGVGLRAQSLVELLLGYDQYRERFLPEGKEDGIK